MFTVLGHVGVQIADSVPFICEKILRVRRSLSNIRDRLAEFLLL